WLRNRAAPAGPMPGPVTADAHGATIAFVSKLADDASVPYAEDRQQIFDPAASRIAAINRAPDQPLGDGGGSLPGTGHDQKLDAFSSSVILRFLTHYQKDRSHGTVY